MTEKIPTKIHVLDAKKDTFLTHRTTDTIEIHHISAVHDGDYPSVMGCLGKRLRSIKIGEQGIFASVMESVWSYDYSPKVAGPVDKIPKRITVIRNLIPNDEFNKYVRYGDRVYVLDFSKVHHYNDYCFDSVGRFRIGCYHLLDGTRLDDSSILEALNKLKEDIIGLHADTVLLENHEVRARLDELAIQVIKTRQLVDEPF